MSRSAVCIASLTVLAGAAHAQIQGPSSSQTPYVLPYQNNPNVVTKSILTVGDTIGGYKMVGIPDGLGAFNNGDGSFTLLMNHELGASVGAVRAHGSKGAFVSRWAIDAASLTVTSGRDHNTSGSDILQNNTGAGWVAASTAYNRLCSADLAAPSAYRFGDLGTDARIYMNGEESGAEGRAFGHVVTGADANKSYELPRLGKFSWENSVANPKAQAKTIVAGTDDSTVNGQVYFYVGNKTNSGNDVERAGLNNGNLYGVRVQGMTSESRTSIPAPGTRFDMFNKGDVSAQTGATINQNSVNNGVTNWLRPEDSVWDSRPGFENNLYFVTTDNVSSLGGKSRLWKMSFDDIANPEAGGTLTNLMTGDEGQNMFDNLTIDSTGRILIQEDPGNNDVLSRIWAFDTNSGKYGIVATADAARFGIGGASFLTRDDESSGIIDASGTLGQGWFLLDMQAHYANADADLVEGGQLLAMYVAPGTVPAPGTIVLGAGALILASRRRR